MEGGEIELLLFKNNFVLQNYVCQICFVFSSHMPKYQIIYFQATFTCTKCQIDCQNKPNLEAHEKVCAGVKKRRYYCKYCNKDYADRKGRNHHEKYACKVNANIYLVILHRIGLMCV